MLKGTTELMDEYMYQLYTSTIQAIHVCTEVDGDDDDVNCHHTEDQQNEDLVFYDLFVLYII